MPERIDVLRAKLGAIRTTLDRTPPKEKKSNAGLELAESFNHLLTEIGELYPELKPDLPKALSTQGHFRSFGQVGASYLDVEVFAEQTLALLDLAASS